MSDSLQELNIALLVITGGALGEVVFCISLFLRGDREWFSYILQPFIGAYAALCFYVVFCAISTLPIVLALALGLFLVWLSAFLPHMKQKYPLKISRRAIVVNGLILLGFSILVIFSQRGLFNWLTAGLFALSFVSGWFAERFFSRLKRVMETVFMPAPKGQDHIPG